MARDKREARRRRHYRLRKSLSGVAERPRLCVFRSLNHIYAQVVDDIRGVTIVGASTLDSEIKADLETKSKKEKADIVGNLIAKRAMSIGVNEVVFDRGGYKYHGRIKALADAARGAGLRF